MNSRLLIALFITVFLYGIYSWFTTKGGSVVDPFDINSQLYESGPVEQPPPTEADPQRQVAPSGPHSPAQAPSSMMPAVKLPEEVPFDPQEQNFESAEMPERLRHPERLFSPGLVSDETATAVGSGIASKAQQLTANASQSFGPEFAQNGGSFLGEVMANDSDMPTSYSSV